MRSPKSFLCITAATIAAFSQLCPAPAVTFGQTEVSQSRFIAVAVPRTSGNYTLLVMEQISDQRSCWREKGNNPTRVDPLLVNFNFTGICGRSTDSNGYSIRMAGQDTALSYRLSLQKRPNDLVLRGIPLQTGTPVEVGRTHGLNPGFLKITLNPGWRFTKRTYQGKKLSHIYFSRTAIAPQSPVEPSPSAPASVDKAKPKTPSLPPSSIKSAVNPSPGPSSGQPLSSATPLPNAPDSARYRVLVVAPNLDQQTQLRTQYPSAFRTSHQGKSVMQMGSFGDRTKAQSLKTELQNQGFKVLLVSKS